ncbi:MAG: polyphosphate kinase 1 [Bacteroidales bacterium]
MSTGKQHMRIKPSKHFINREISWLQFNERVLQEAMDERNPLIERLKFLGIFSNNRDEFFRVRVASLNRMLLFPDRSYDREDDPEMILRQIKEIVARQERKFTQTFFHLRDALDKNGIHLIDETRLDEEQKEFIVRFYQEELRPFLFPIMLENFRHPASIKDGSIYLAIELKSSDEKIKKNYALIKVPQKSLSRFVILPRKGEDHYIILLDDVIRFCLPFIFGKFGYDEFHAYTIKMTRDAELDIDDDVSRSFLEKLSESLKQRKKGIPVRFVYDREIPDKLLKKIIKKLAITNEDSIRSGGRYHNFKDFMSFPSIGKKELFYPPFPPVRHPNIIDHESIIHLLQHRDILLHFPYQSFNYIIDFLREASIDPKVVSIKMTLYRAARYSNVVNALVNAARNGKEVTVYLEIQARFDEEANITLWGKLQDEGVRIIPTIPGYKVHCKLISVKRREGDDFRFYANISTGNFNESTARVYSDLSLLTARQEITREVEDVFTLFESRFEKPVFRHLAVSPVNTRSFFTKMLDEEIQNARQGKEAWAVIKLNSLVDKKMVRKLYQASQEGVRIQMIIRGICVLIPGIKGISENIEVISIIDRFLEHARTFVFANGGNPLFFIGSADWMPRNLDHRVEVITPIFDPEIKKEIWDILQLQLNDNQKARIIDGKRTNAYRRQGKVQPVRSQFATYEYFRQKAENRQLPDKNGSSQ